MFSEEPAAARASSIGRQPGWGRLRALAVILALAGGALAASCSSTSEPATGDLLLDLRHRDPLVRVRAAIEAERRDRFDLIGLLVENLDHNDGPVRMFSGAALRRLTGKDFGYKPYGTPYERELAIERWQSWWREAGSRLVETRRDASAADGVAAEEEEVFVGETVWN